MAFFPDQWVQVDKKIEVQFRETEKNSLSLFFLMCFEGRK